MPGTIHISVLEVRDLPSSSSPDSVSIRVAMGKREYQVADRGDFSIPLTTLREDMLVKVLDANGVEISRTGIETKKVVEKGSWNDSFPLEGGGEMLLKLQFVLSEEEQNRIRMMRLSALKKKDGEIVSKSPVLPEKAPSPSLEQKKVELTNQRVLSRDEAATTSSPRHAFHVKPRTDEVTPLQQDTSVGRSGDGDDPPRPSPLLSVAVTPASETGLRKLARTSNPEATSASAPHKLKGGVWDVQRPPKKTPSSIRTMISVFESGRVPESRALLKTSGGNNKMASTTSLEDSTISWEFPEQVAPPTKGGAISDPLRAESQLLSRKEIQERLRPASVRVNPDPSPSSAEIAVSADSTDSDIHRENNKVQIQDNFCRDEDSDICREKNRVQIRDNVRRDEGTPSIWIYPDDSRSICITTGGKHAIRLMECCVETITTTLTEHPGEGTMPRKIEHNAKERERASCDVKPLSSAGGPSGQAMRIAVMVGFGVLVLFTGRRRDR